MIGMSIARSLRSSCPIFPHWVKVIVSIVDPCGKRLVRVRQRRSDRRRFADEFGHELRDEILERILVVVGDDLLVKLIEQLLTIVVDAVVDGGLHESKLPAVAIAAVTFDLLFGLE